ncbi:unnamed protein product [Colletotrichum noveboracense]|uniref:Uncharacterized protein n=1 Tax=Colletotrichum noveboracense TaxID=2664923 RepID=A0A9W4RTK5_9PEZI|nr:unnamed protein product [Colletotrichum noveboracense]
MVNHLRPAPAPAQLTLPLPARKAQTANGRLRRPAAPARLEARQGAQHLGAGGARDPRGLLPLRGADARLRQGGRHPDVGRAVGARGAGDPAGLARRAAEFVEILDPEGEGFVGYEPFFAICALKYHQRETSGAGGEERRREVEEAFRLFTGVGSSSGGRDVISLADLKRVAGVLREDVKDEVLRDMILEANGGAGVGRGVRREEFEEVMRRAGVWRCLAFGKAWHGMMIYRLQEIHDGGQDRLHFIQSHESQNRMYQGEYRI